MSQPELPLTERFDLFLVRARELQETRLVQETTKLNWSMQFSSDGELTITADEPDEEALRSFLRTLRQFMMGKEPIFLNRVHNLLHLHLTSDELKGHLATNRAALTHAAQGKGIEVMLNDARLTPEHLMDLWINGWYFHNDLSKRQELAGLIPHEALMIKHRFITYALDMTQIILWTGQLINHARREGLLNEV